MARSEKPTAKNSYGAGPNALRFVASLFFLYVVFGGAYGNGWWSPWVTSGAGSLWTPILLGAAVLSSIGLFLGSLAGMAWKMVTPMGWRTSIIAAFSLTALTVSLSFSSVFWIVMIGFILNWVASGMEMMM